MSSWNKLLQDANPRGHLVQLYKSDERLLIRNVAEYISAGLSRGQSLLVIATQEHSQAAFLRLEHEGVDVQTATHNGRLLIVDAVEAVDRSLENGRPDWSRFDDVVGTLIRQIAARPDYSGLRVHTEMAGVLWKKGFDVAAIQLERFWNNLLASQAFSLFCAYPIDVFDQQFQISTLDALLCSHTHLLPTGVTGQLENAINRAMEEVLGPRVNDLKLLIKANYRPSWAVLPRAEAIVLWIRNNLPDDANAILTRARRYYRPGEAPAPLAADAATNSPLD